MEANLGDFPPPTLVPVVSRQSLGRFRARLQSVSSSSEGKDEEGMSVINTARLPATRPGRGEINRRDTEGG